MFKEIVVDLPSCDADVVLRFPGKKDLLYIQLRPSNADVGYNGSLDIVLPGNQAVTNWEGDNMKAAEPVNGIEHIRLARQLVVELPGDYSEPASSLTPQDFVGVPKEVTLQDIVNRVNFERPR